MWCLLPIESTVLESVFVRRIGYHINLLSVAIAATAHYVISLWFFCIVSGVVLARGSYLIVFSPNFEAVIAEVSFIKQ